jgi:transcriptional regulator with XRE-family HTH domain
MTFPERLRELRDAAGLSEAKLAEISGVPFGTLHNYGLGLRKPTFAAVVKLARALGVDCTAFAGCDDVTAGNDSPAEVEQPAGEKPAAQPRPKPGRPRRPKAASAEQEQPPPAPKPRRRP